MIVGVFWGNRIVGGESKKEGRWFGKKKASIENQIY